MEDIGRLERLFAAAAAPLPEHLAPPGGPGVHGSMAKLVAVIALVENVLLPEIERRQGNQSGLVRRHVAGNLEGNLPGAGAVRAVDLRAQEVPPRQGDSQRRDSQGDGDDDAQRGPRHPRLPTDHRKSSVETSLPGLSEVARLGNSHRQLHNQRSTSIGGIGIPACADRGTDRNVCATNAVIVQAVNNLASPTFRS